MHMCQDQSLQEQSEKNQASAPAEINEVLYSPRFLWFPPISARGRAGSYIRASPWEQLPTVFQHCTLLSRKLSSSAHPHRAGTHQDPTLYPQQSPASTVGRNICNAKRSSRRFPPQDNHPLPRQEPRRRKWSHGSTQQHSSPVMRMGLCQGSGLADNAAPPQAGRVLAPSLTLQQNRKTTGFFLVLKLPANTSNGSMSCGVRASCSPPTPAQGMEMKTQDTTSHCGPKQRLKVFISPVAGGNR